MARAMMGAESSSRIGLLRMNGRSTPWDSAGSPETIPAAHLRPRRGAALLRTHAAPREVPVQLTAMMLTELHASHLSARDGLTYRKDISN